MSAGTEVILLGTGTPNAEPERSVPAVALITDGRPYLVDFGPGVVRRAATEGLDVTELNRAFLTHLHSDHTAGYPDLILTPWVLGRKGPLKVHGPRGLKSMTGHLLQLLWGATEGKLLGEIRTDYDGEVAFGRDLDGF